MMNPTLLADHFAKCVRKCFSEKSEIEFEDDYLPTKSFLDTTTFDRVHTSANLPAFLEQFAEKGRAELSTCEEKATPHTLVVTPSGIRTAFLNRELRIFNTEESKVAKRDEKKRTIFEMAELFRPLMALLNIQPIRQRYGSQDNKVDLLVY